MGYGSWLLANGVSGVAADATYQGLAVLAGYQDQYDVRQTMIAFGVAGVLGMGGKWANSLFSKTKPACFTEGTQIVVGMGLAEDGTVLYDTKNIEDIEVGDLVYSYNTITGEYEYSEVTSTMALTSKHVCYLTIEDEQGNEQTIETTDAHPFWVVSGDPDLTRAAGEYVNENGVWLYHENMVPTDNGYWVEAKYLRVGDVFLDANDQLSKLTNKVRLEQDGGIAVFNFTVEGNHNYFVLAKNFGAGQSCVLVHNAMACVSSLNGRQLPDEYSGNLLKRLRSNMKKNGFDPSQPIQVADIDGYLVIIDGHHRARAAGAAGISQVPIEIVDISPDMANQLLVEAAQVADFLNKPLAISLIK